MFVIRFRIHDEPAADAEPFLRRLYRQCTDLDFEIRRTIGRKNFRWRPQDTPQLLPKLANDLDDAHFRRTHLRTAREQRPHQIARAY
jgi:hypothetical protein